MNIFNTIAVAIALAMDAFAVAISAGVTLRRVTYRQYFRLAWHFGLFQAMMPLIGWGFGRAIHGMIERWAPWIAFVLLAYVGLGMLKEAFSKESSKGEKIDPTRGMTMVMLSVATSIDALAVGFSLSMIGSTIWLPVLIIGLVAGAFTICGMYIGKTIGSVERLGRIAEVCGGIILLIIGFNILREHDALTFLL
jgi:putative Mn2+ efflux pump MntP